MGRLFSRKRKRQFIGLVSGLVISIVTYIILSLPSGEKYLSLGPMNTGHDDLKCTACHLEADGTALQQITANFKHKFSMRKTGVDFGHYDVDNSKCLACHDRPNDRHPVHRFKEPRFKKARKKIDPIHCESCHREHQGIRMTQGTTTFCINCHSDLKMNKDPLDVPHSTLVETNQWQTCLQCHDFHGNHIYEAPNYILDTIAMKKIEEYINGGKDPYSDKKKYLPTNTPLLKQKKK